MITKRELNYRIIDLEKQADEFDERIGELEARLKNDNNKKSTI